MFLGKNIKSSKTLPPSQVDQPVLHCTNTCTHVATVQSIAICNDSNCYC